MGPQDGHCCRLGITKAFALHIRNATGKGISFKTNDTDGVMYVGSSCDNKKTRIDPKLNRIDPKPNRIDPKPEYPNRNGGCNASSHRRHAMAKHCCRRYILLLTVPPAQRDSFIV
jgi:hypothetical protein